MGACGEAEGEPCCEDEVCNPGLVCGFTEDRSGRQCWGCGGDGDYACDGTLPPARTRNALLHIFSRLQRKNITVVSCAFTLFVPIASIHICSSPARCSGLSPHLYVASSVKNTVDGSIEKPGIFSAGCSVLVGSVCLCSG